MTEVAGAGSRGRGSSKTRLRDLAIALVLSAIAAVAAFVAARRPAAAPSAAVRAELPKHSGNSIEFTAELRDSADIATEPAVRGPLAPLITVVGEAAFDPTLVAAVGARGSGIVREVRYVEGNVVRRGDVLAVIESPGLAEAQADERIAVAKKRAATLNAERERTLLDQGLTTAREFEQADAELAEQTALLQAAHERVAALGGAGREKTGASEVRAPVSGVVAERSIAPGQSIGPGLVAFRVGSLDRLWVLLRVYERHLEPLREGDAVEIRPLADTDRVIDGKVAHVGSVVDPETHTADVRVEVANEARLLRPGQAVKATIRASGGARTALSVPASAITSVDGVPTVFVAETPTRFAARKVELGIDAGDRVEVKSGIKEGEAVVSKNVLFLKSELFR